MTESSLCIALIAALAQLILPLPSGVFVTLQTFGVAFCGYYLGARRGSIAVVVYLLLGAVGLPVFSALTGGFSSLIGLTGGYLWGFIPLAFFCGIKGKMPLRLALGFLGLLACHGAGALWYSLFAGAEVVAALLAVTLPTLWKDALCLLLALWLSERIKKILNR